MHGSAFDGGYVRPEAAAQESPTASRSEAASPLAKPNPTSSGSDGAPAPRPARGLGDMLLSTTDSLEGWRIERYCGLVDCDVIAGANAIRDLFASVRDLVGGRVGGYEKVLAEAKRDALASISKKARERGANAIVGIDLDFEVIQIEGGGSMLMVSATGTAVAIREL